MQQAVQQVKDSKDADYQQLYAKHEELAAVVVSLQESVAAQNSSNSKALQVCHHSQAAQSSKADSQTVQKCFTICACVFVAWLTPKISSAILVVLCQA